MSEALETPLTPPPRNSDLGTVEPGGFPTAGAVVSVARKLTLYDIVAIAFILTAAGPFGVEATVASGGARNTLIGFILVPFFYIFPQVLIVSELCAMMPTNDGSVVWIREAFGPFASYSCSLVTFGINFVDLAIYAVLFTSYFCAQIFSSATSVEKYFISVVPIILGMCVGFLETKAAAKASLVISVLSMIPYVIGFCVALPHMKPSDQWDMPATKPDTAMFVSTMAWCFTGWSKLGNLAGEVEKPAVFSVGLSVTVVIDILVYVIPVTAALTIPNMSWEEGTIGSIYDKVMPGLGSITDVATAMAIFGMYTNSILCYSRQAASMAGFGFFPKQFGYLREGTTVPWFATIVYTIGTLILATFDFKFLLKLDLLLIAEIAIIVGLTFLRLRYKFPDSKRPFSLPCGLPGAWIQVMIKVAAMSTIIILNLTSDVKLVIWNAAVVVVVCLSWVWYVHRRNAQEAAGASSHSNVNTVTMEEMRAAVSGGEDQEVTVV